MNKIFKNILIWGSIIVLFFVIFSNLGSGYSNYKKISYSQFIKKLQNFDVKELTVDKQLIEGVTRNDQYFITYSPTLLDQYTIEEEWINKYNVNVKGKQPEQQSFLVHIFMSWFPLIVFLVIWFFFYETGARWWKKYFIIW